MQEKQQKEPLQNREQIGAVTLDYTCYPGKDLYSDGEIEQQLLEIAENIPEEELNAEIARRKDWSVLYHMSDIRENIAAALPIGPKDKVLEIGAGCGAITGVLARKAGQVTCVDLSRRRSLVNAYRHRSYENIRILVGNFQDIEKRLTETYDYITLIGVFEYAQGYIGTEEPYTEFLRQIKRHLSPGGRIVIAIENRLGLKYWAGCREDHTGNFFEGLENYSHGAFVRTFSRPELEKLFRKAGFHHSSFYYPYPDYKLPMVIYSDAYLPEPGSLHRPLYHFDRDRMTLFDENAVCDSLIAGGQFPLFSNSYLVILEEEKPAAPDTEDAFRSVYTKFSLERDPQYALRTDIEEGKAGQRRVVKRAVTQKANAHVQAIADRGAALEQLFDETKIHVNRILPPEQNSSAHGAGERGAGADGLAAVCFEYIDGKITLENHVTKLLSEGKTEEAFSEIRSLTDLVRSRADQTFAVSDAFASLFGTQAAEQAAGRTDLMSASVTDIDMVPENLLLRQDGGWDLIDYEWSYDIPIPVDFVAFRIWHYFIARCLPGSSAETLLQEEGFSQQDISLYTGMERSWQQHVKGQRVSLDELHEVIAPPEVDVRSELMLHEDRREESYTGGLYFAEDGVFTEKQKRTTALTVDEQGHFTALISLEGLPSGMQLRWDPLERRMCRIHIETIDCPGAVLTPINGTRQSSDGEHAAVDEFMTVDPAYRLEGIPAGTAQIRLEGTMEMIYLENRMQQFEQLRLERDTYYAEMQRLRGQIEALHRTKAYRFAKALKRLTGRQ